MLRYFPFYDINRITGTNYNLIQRKNVSKKHDVYFDVSDHLENVYFVSKMFCRDLLMSARIVYCTMHL